MLRNKATLDKVILDETLRAKLPYLDGIMEVCDESGQTLGHYLPVDVDTRVLEAVRQCPHSEEELERRQHESGGRTLAEIWKSLGITA
jgi:hypothetical protein